MESSFKILKKHKLLVQKYTGVFCFDEFYEHVKLVMHDPDWKDVEKIITDLRNIDLKVFYENMDNFLKFRDEKIMKSYFNIFLVDKPLSTAVVHLYKSKLNNDKYKYEYCSTLDYALAFLRLPEEKAEIEGILDNL